MDACSIESLPRPGIKSSWTRLCQKRPPQGVVVLTKMQDEYGSRNFLKLKCQGRYWFYPDGRAALHVPTHWMQSL